jgi:pimeloyl-ACP methyl ester carboxylesterase
VNRRRGLRPGATIADLAEDYAQVIREHLDPPVDVMAVSTGATIGLRLALQHPDLVRRLVVVGASSLSETGRRCQRDVIEHLQAGRPRRAAARMFATMAGGPPSRAALALLGFLVGKRMYGGDVADMLVTAEAELDEDLEHELSRIATPTLVIGGARDRFYSPALFRSTAAGLTRGSLVLFGRRGHLGTMSSPGLVEDVLNFLDDRPLHSPMRRPQRRRSDSERTTSP